MKILVDTNIILDFLLERDPFHINAIMLMKAIDEGKYQAFITANSITDVVYVAKKKFPLEIIKRAVLELLENIDVIGVNRDDIISAFDLGFNDFEDALQSACSEKEQVEFIITRDKKDYKRSKILAIDVEDLLLMR
jgi:predicted nucleic acid-binding protein